MYCRMTQNCYNVIFSLPSLFIRICLKMRFTVRKDISKQHGKRKEYKWILDCEAKPHLIFYTFLISIFIGLFIGLKIPNKWSNQILNTVLSTDCPNEENALLVFPNSFKFKGRLKSVKKLRKISGDVLISVSLEQSYATGLGEIESSANTWGKDCQNRSKSFGSQCLYYVAQDWLPSDKWMESGQESVNDRNLRQHVIRLEDVPHEDGNGLKKKFVMLYHMYMQYSKR